MVRLKGETVSRLVDGRSPFQFLMVRLKDRIERAKAITTAISIPYGAIKSYFIRKLTYNIHHISIPYGAIKSVAIAF